MDTGESKAQQIRLKQQHLRAPGFSSYTPQLPAQNVQFSSGLPPPLSFQTTALVLHLLRCCLPLPLDKRQSQDMGLSPGSGAAAKFSPAARCLGAASITAPCARTSIKSQHKIPHGPLARSSARQPATPPALPALQGHPLTRSSPEEWWQDEQEQLHPSLSRCCGRQVEL